MEVNKLKYLLGEKNERLYTDSIERLGLHVDKPNAIDTVESRTSKKK